MVSKIAALDFDTLLYLVFAIVGGLYSFFQKKNKEAQKPKPASNTRKKEPTGKRQFNPIDEFLKTLQPEEEEKPKKQFVPQNRSVAQKKKEDVFQPVDEAISYQFKDDNIKVSSFSNELNDEYFSNNVSKSQQIRYQVNGEEREITPQDMVIANAILNRPYT